MRRIAVAPALRKDAARRGGGRNRKARTWGCSRKRVQVRVVVGGWCAGVQSPG